MLCPAPSTTQQVLEPDAWGHPGKNGVQLPSWGPDLVCWAARSPPTQGRSVALAVGVGVSHSQEKPVAAPALSHPPLPEELPGP